MKTLIISDTHLGKKLNIPKYDYLRTIIELADAVIINGDFWDHLYQSFDEFIHSPWSKLFDLLKERRTVYLYGNHDREEWCDDRVFQFSDNQGYHHVLKSGGASFYLTHGHIYTLTEIIHNRTNLTLEKIGWYCSDFVEKMGTALLGEDFYVLVQEINEEIKRKTSHMRKDSDFVICGHTHRAEFDAQHRFINSGVNRYGIGQYLMIEDGEVSQYSVRY